MPVTWMPGMSGRFSGRLPYTRTHENEASLTVSGETTFVQFELKCRLLVGEMVLKAG